MNSVSLSLRALAARPFSNVLAVLAIAISVMLLWVAVFLAGSIAQSFARNAAGIDLVISAKGSPLQAVLSSVYHIDIPVGNIEGKEAERMMRHPMIARAIPLALGDNYRGFRIVGTTPDFIELYGGVLASGAMPQKPFDALAGANAGLVSGQSFAGAHGLSGESEHVHDEQLYTVTGVLKPTGTVLDRLIMTSVQSVQKLHEGHDHEHGHEYDHEHDHHHEHEDHGDITAILAKVKSPLAVMNLPREIGRTTGMMAVSPAFEMTRLSVNIGLGRDTIVLIAFMFALFSALNLFAVMSAGLMVRQYDLALLRVLGASRFKIFATVMSEGLILGVLGGAFGLVGGRMVVCVMMAQFDQIAFLSGENSLWAFTALDLFVLAGAALAGLMAALPVAIRVIRLDIARLLSSGY